MSNFVYNSYNSVDNDNFVDDDNFVHDGDKYLLLNKLESLYPSPSPSFDKISYKPENLFYNDYNDTQLDLLKNNSKFFDSSHLKKHDDIPIPLNLNLPQVIPQKSNIGLLCKNPECFNEVKFNHFGKGRKKEYCCIKCSTRRSNCNRKKNRHTNINETLSNDRKELEKLINKGASRFNIDLFYYYFLFREEIREMQNYFIEKHKPLMEKRQKFSKKTRLY
jgi:hypothetical protein